MEDTSVKSNIAEREKTWNGNRLSFGRDIVAQSKLYASGLHHHCYLSGPLMFRLCPDESTSKRFLRVLGVNLKVAELIALLYLFICSLGLLSDSFQLVGGKQAGEIFQNNEILRSPVAGLMIGVMATVILQSSSTTTSIIVSMVASSMLSVHAAIPIVMGANIGTSMTNTLVSLGQSGDRTQFQRAFAAATVHDMFNWLSVIVLLPIEVACGPLEKLTGSLVEPIKSIKGGSEPKLLSLITDLFIKQIIQIDKNKITKIAMNANATNVGSLIKRCVDNNNTIIPGCKYKHIFANTSWSDKTVGVLLLVVSLAVLISCLVAIVKLLQSMLQGRVKSVIHEVVDKDFPGVFRHFTGYFVMFVGCVMTILVQSSSVFTSALTPLVGVGVLSLDRMYSLTLGANIGTTFTSVLAALASTKIQETLQIALCHLFFNLFGILIFYPVPIMRKLPLGAANFLGHKTAKYRWFAIVYLAIMFFILPISIVALSLAGTVVVLFVLGPLLICTLIIIIINILQIKKPSWLSKRMRDWNFLPECLRSLQPFDRIIAKIGSQVVVCSGRKCCCPSGAVDAQVRRHESDSSIVAQKMLLLNMAEIPDDNDGNESQKEFHLFH